MTLGVEPLVVERGGYVLRVTLNRPERRNALNQELMDALRALWGDAKRLHGVRCVVLTGAQPGFCSGADMSLLADDRSAAPTDVREEMSFLPGLQIDCPVVVAVNGVCAGGGLHFPADADIAIASSDSSFLDPHVSVGQVTALEPLEMWPRATAQAVLRMALIGRTERLDAAAALRAGLISEVVEPDRLTERAQEIAGEICKNSPAAVTASRRAIRTPDHELRAAAMQRGWDLIRDHWAHPDSKEGLAAFVEKREPQWRHGDG
jgi:enoyl-CoA hydratase/carnithine racemase